jgi:F-type H+-transporting ATPase subunit b
VKRLSLATVALLLPLAALAEEVPEGHAGHGAPWLKLLFMAINLAIFIRIAPAVARLLLGVDLWEWAATRREKVATALAEADRAKREAEAMRAEWQRRLERLGGELEAMLAQARTDIAKERDQILAAARKSAEAIHRDAQRTADNELRSAQEILRAEVAKQALAIAERLAAQRLTAADQQRFVAEFVAQVHDR